MLVGAQGSFLLILSLFIAQWGPTQTHLEAGEVRLCLLWDTGRDRLFTSCSTKFVAKGIKFQLRACPAAWHSELHLLRNEKTFSISPNFFALYHLKLLPPLFLLSHSLKHPNPSQRQFYTIAHSLLFSGSRPVIFLPLHDLPLLTSPSIHFYSSFLLTSSHVLPAQTPLSLPCHPSSLPLSSCPDSSPHSAHPHSCRMNEEVQTPLAKVLCAQREAGSARAG